MDDKRILELVSRSISKLLAADKILLQRDLNEPCISHKLAEYLQTRFLEYNVDCEYNGDVDRRKLRKRIIRMDEDENSLKEFSVIPDIIIHKRGRNDQNLCIIEIKKSTNQTNLDLDRRKLEAYTSTSDGNNLNYQIGFFLIFTTNVTSPSFKMEIYKNGGKLINGN